MHVSTFKQREQFPDFLSGNYIHVNWTTICYIVKMVLLSKSIHTIEKFTCNGCGFQTSNTQLFTKHQKSLHEDSKYPCDSCDFKATKRGSLTAHNRSIHKGKKYPCDLCDHKATQGGDLTRHKQS
jgi:hypothetical protein